MTSTFLKSNYANNKADTFSPGSSSQLVETQTEEECDCHSDLSSRLGALEGQTFLIFNKLKNYIIFNTLKEECRISVIKHSNKHST